MNRPNLTQLSKEIEKPKKISLSKFRVGDDVYLYDGHGCTLVTILEAYMIDNEWYYEIDCSMLKSGMILEQVSEIYLGRNTNPDISNKRISHKTIREWLNMVD